MRSIRLAMLVSTACVVIRDPSLGRWVVFPTRVCSASVLPSQDVANPTSAQVCTGIQIGSGVSIPLVDFLMGYSQAQDTRVLYVPIVFWAASGFMGILGLVAAFMKDSILLSAYLALVRGRALRLGFKSPIP